MTSRLTNRKLLMAGITVSVTISVLVASPILSAFAQTPGYTNVIGSNATLEPVGGFAGFEVTTAANIPDVADTYINSVLGFGYAWLDSSGNAVVATIHPEMNDNNPNPNLWHGHTITLDAAKCVTGSQNPDAFISVSDNILQLNMMPSSATVTPSTLSSTMAFQFIQDSTTCQPPLSGLKLAAP